MTTPFPPIPGSMRAVTPLKPSGDVTGVQDVARINAAIASLPPSGGTVYLASGTWYHASTITITTPVALVYLDASLVNYLGNGACYRIFSSSAIPPNGGAGIYGNPVIDGTSHAAGASYGVQAGDWTYLEFYATVQNFTQPGDIGWYFVNTVSYTERLHGSIQSFNNSSLVVFDVAGTLLTSTASFARPNLDIWLNAQPNQDGVVFQNGAQPYHGKIAIRGNFQGYTAAQSTCVLRVTGQVPAGHPGAGNYSRILACQLDIQVETTNTGGTNQPRTVILGSVGNNAIRSCYGAISFAWGTTGFLGASFQAIQAARSFEFTGPIEGDSNLNAAAGPGSSPPGPAQIQYSGIIYPAAFSSSGGSIYTLSGDSFEQTLSNNLTINLAAETGNTLPAPQRKVIIIHQAASGGPFTVTWPNPGTPSTSTPAIKWAGGTAPVMTATAGATDVYILYTNNGTQWYGTAIQNAS